MNSYAFLKYWLPLLIWIVVMFVSSTDLMSAEHTSRFMIPMLLWLKPGMSGQTVLAIISGVRKSAHVFEYAILALLLFRALNGVVSRGRRVWVFVVGAWVLCILVAISDEFHQSFVPSRTASVRDVFLDSGGALLGTVIGGCFAEYNYKKARRKRDEVVRVES
jgi:VanZ family protein